MQKFIGTKLINANPMTRSEYNQFRGWGLPSNENGDNKGYLVEHIDGGAANTPGYEGHVSWSPDDVFNEAYRPVTRLSFGLAIEALKKGAKVCRSGWNGKGMWLALMGSSDWNIEDGSIPPARKLPFIGMKTADDCFVPWFASQTDMLADDWQMLD